jgi:type III secretion protein J
MNMQKTISRPLWMMLLLSAFLMVFTACGSKKTIVNGLDEREANEILVFLSGKGIEATKTQSAEAGGGTSKVILWDIQVNSDESTEAMAMLNQAGLPRRRSQNLLNIFAGGSLVPSELQEKIRYQAGLAEQIASTIRKIDGILDAEVQISFPEEDPLHPGQTKGKITASVYVKHNGVLDDPNSQLVSKIKRLVAASITGLDYNNVTVIGDRARANAPGTEAMTTGAEEEKPLVNVWSMILAKESLTRFRIVFFSFILVILLLVLALVWLIWKINPLLKNHGGLKELFHVHPIKTGPPAAPAAAAAPPSGAAQKPPEPAAKSKEEEAKTDKDVDVT